MSVALSFICSRDQSPNLHNSFNFGNLNKNLLDDFNKCEYSILNKDELMPVYLRIRPLNSGEPPIKVVFARDATTALLKLPAVEKGLRTGMFAFGQSSHEFTFNRVFDEATSQAEIFQAAVVTRVREFLEGVNGLVCAYGTTSSGKTYSLQGNARNRGVIPRALEYIFRNATLNSIERLTPRGFDEVQEMTKEETEKRMREKAQLLRLASTAENTQRSLAVSCESVRPLSTNLSAEREDEAMATEEEACSETPFAYKDSAAFCFWISFVEIYNEVVYDLLDPNLALTVVKSNGAPPSGLCGGGGGVGDSMVGSVNNFRIRRTPLDLRSDKRGNVFVKGVRWYAVASAEEAYALVSVGRCCQRVSSTRLNESSSRSHSILTVRAFRSRLGASASGSTVGSSSLLSFCDLAGSERCTKAETLAQVQRLREANSINTSLLTLGKCIEALRHNQRRCGANPCVVPYRESRLTRLFQNFFAVARPGVGVDAVNRGRGRACLLVNAAPCAPLAEETLHALRFSALAAQVLVVPAAPRPLASLKDMPSMCVPAATASAVIHGQLRAQLLRQGFHLRLPGRRDSRVNEAITMAAADARTKARTRATKVEDVERKEELIEVGCAGDGEVGSSRRSLGEWVEMEAVETELERLPRKALMEVVRELMAVVVEALPSEVEAARNETRALVTTTMGEELLRMEEQYELLLQRQEEEFEKRLLAQRRQEWKERRRISRLHRRPSGSISAAAGAIDDDSLVLSPLLAVEEVIESGAVGVAHIEKPMQQWTVEPSAKTRRVEEMNTKVTAELEEDCPSCAYYEEEVARLREQMEEARGDLVDQQDAIAGVMAQRDNFQVEARRLEFLLQLTTQRLDLNPTNPASTTTATAPIFPSLLSIESATGCNAKEGFLPSSFDADATIVKQPALSSALGSASATVTRYFPPLVSAPNRMSADTATMPQTPATAVPVKRQGRRDGGGGGEGQRSGQWLCTESPRLASQLADLRLDSTTTERSQRTAASLQQQGKKIENTNEKVRSQFSKSTSRMASFLAHEVEADAEAEAEPEMALRSRCDKLSAELSDTRRIHQQNLAQLADLQRRLREYEQMLQKQCIQQQQQEEEEEEGKERGEGVAARPETVAEVEANVGGRCRPRRMQGQRRRKERSRKATAATSTSMSTVSEASVVTSFSVPEVTELSNSDTENALSEQLARSLTRIQSSDVVRKKASGSKRRDGKGKQLSAGVPGSGCKTEEQSPLLNMRRLAPLLETSQFLGSDAGEGTPQPTQRVLRPRKGG